MQATNISTCFDLLQIILRVSYIKQAHQMQMNYQIDQNSSDYTFNLLDNSSMFYICLYDVRLPDDELKNIEKCMSFNTCECYLKSIINKCIILYIMYFTMNLLLRVSEHLLSSRS